MHSGSVDNLYLQIADMLEDKRVIDIYGLANLVVHCVNISLVHSHALLGQGRCIIDGDVVELWVILPVLICKRT